MISGPLQAEDVVAQAYCSIGRPNDALPHCRLAIQVCYVATSVLMDLVSNFLQILYVRGRREVCMTWASLASLLFTQILENIYSRDHIAVANERLKLASIALAANDDNEVQSNLALVDQVMRVHYGADYRSMLHLEDFHQLQGIWCGECALAAGSNGAITSLSAENQVVEVLSVDSIGRKRLTDHIAFRGLDKILTKFESSKPPFLRDWSIWILYSGMFAIGFLT